MTRESGCVLAAGLGPVQLFTLMRGRPPAKAAQMPSAAACGTSQSVVEKNGTVAAEIFRARLAIAQNKDVAAFDGAGIITNIRRRRTVRERRGTQAGDVAQFTYRLGGVGLHVDVIVSATSKVVMRDRVVVVGNRDANVIRVHHRSAYVIGTEAGIDLREFALALQFLARVNKRFRIAGALADFEDETTAGIDHIIAAAAGNAKGSLSLCWKEDAGGKAEREEGRSRRWDEQCQGTHAKPWLGLGLRGDPVGPGFVKMLEDEGILVLVCLHGGYYCDSRGHTILVFPQRSGGGGYATKSRSGSGHT